MADLGADWVSQRGAAPVPVEQNPTKPVPPALKEGRFWVETQWLEDIGDFFRAKRRVAAYVIRTRIKEGCREKVGDVGREEDN